MFKKVLYLVKRKIKSYFIEPVLIHIGKCGGSTVRTELKKADIKFVEKHICKVTYSNKKRYILIVRNPISRFISAFNWRYKLVIDDGTQSNRFKGEKELLKKYDTVNKLAENIYNNDGTLNLDFSKKQFYIHHITEDINFYIGKFLKNCERKNIIAVIATETLNEDLKKLFDIEIRSHKKKNSGKYNNYLSNLAYRNLRKYLKKDYDCIKKLYELDLITKEKYDILSK